MKNLIHRVELIIADDDATGEYGLVKQNDQDHGFNSFWNGIGIFHDVFEHWFEQDHKYFMGDYAYNVGGEMTAMGACMFFADEMNVCNRISKGHYHYTDTIRNST